MKLPNPAGLLRVGRTFVIANRPEILFGASITATLGAVVLAAKGGWDARGLVDDKEAENRDTYAAISGRTHQLTKREIANLTWHCYMPAALATLTAVGSTTGLHYVHIKDKKAMATMALAAIEQVKEDAKAFEKENLGVLSNDEKARILEDRQDETPVGEGESSHMQYSDGEIEELYLVRDHLTGRDVWSNQHRIQDALIEVSNVINGSGSCELAHFYSHAGFGTVPMGITHGWSGTLPSIKWSSTVRDDGRPVREFTFRPPPTEDYDSAHPG